MNTKNQQIRSGLSTWAGKTALMGMAMVLLSGTAFSQVLNEQFNTNAGNTSSLEAAYTNYNYSLGSPIIGSVASNVLSLQYPTPGSTTSFTATMQSKTVFSGTVPETISANMTSTGGSAGYYEVGFKLSGTGADAADNTTVEFLPGYAGPGDGNGFQVAGSDTTNLVRPNSGEPSFTTPEGTFMNLTIQGDGLGNFTFTLTNPSNQTYSGSFTDLGLAPSFQVSLIVAGQATATTPSTGEFEDWTVTQVPEPNSLALIGLGGLAILVMRARYLGKRQAS